MEPRSQVLWKSNAFSRFLQIHKWLPDHSLSQVWCQALTSVANGLTCHPPTYSWHWIKPNQQKEKKESFLLFPTTSPNIMAAHSRIQCTEDLGERSWRLLQWKPYKSNISILKSLPVTLSLDILWDASLPLSPVEAPYIIPFFFYLSLAVLFSRTIQLLLPFTWKKIHHPFPCKLIKILRRTRRLAHHKCHPSLGTFVLERGIYCLHSKWKVQGGFSWVLS